MAGAPVDPTPLLTGFARADAAHDFVGKYSPNAIVPDIFNDSVWTAGRMPPIPNEDAVLNLIEAPPASEEPKSRSFKDKITTPTADEQIRTNTGYTFTVSKVPLNAVGVELATNLGIKDSVLVVDTFSHRFLARLKDGPYTPATKVYYVYLPESENDPGGKASADTLPSKMKSGIDLVHLIQKNTGPTVYATSDGYEPTSPLKNFNSKFTFTLSGLRPSTMQGFKRISVETRVKDRTGRMEQAVFDAKSQNSINAIQKNVFDAILGRGPLSEKDTFNLQAAWGRKRSGDWLQVLACKNLDGRLFNQPLPKNTPVYFVTIDRIAMAYALSMGVNVLFFLHSFRDDADVPSVVVFRQGSPIDRIAACQSRVDSYIKDESIEKFLTAIIENRENTLAEQIAGIDSLVLDSSSKDDLKKLLDLSLAYAHTHLAYAPHAESLRRILTSPEADPCVKASAYDDLKILRDTHGEDVTIREGFLTTIPNYTQSITNLINLFPVQGRAPKFAHDPDSPDKFSFMSYLSKVQDENALRRILQTKLRALHDGAADGQTKKYLSTILGRARLSLYVPETPVDVVTIDTSKDVIRQLQGTKVRRVETEGSDPKRRRLGGHRRTRRKQRGGWKADTIFPETTVYDEQDDLIAVATFRLLNIGEELADRYLPIYMMLEALLRQVDTTMLESEEYTDYLRLYALLHGSIGIANKEEKIGLVLRDLLFTRVQLAEEGVNIQTYLGSDLGFTLICSSLSRALCGEFDEKKFDVPIDESVKADLQRLYKGPAMFASSDEFSKAILNSQSAIYEIVSQEKPVEPTTPVSEKNEEMDKGMLSQARSTGSVTSSDVNNSMVETLVGTQSPAPSAVGSRSPPSSDRGSFSPPSSLGDGSGSGPEGGRRRRKTRRVVLDFLPMRRHQSIKMSSSRHSVSDKELSF